MHQVFLLKESSLVTKLTARSLSNLTINYSSASFPTGNLPLWGTPVSLRFPALGERCRSDAFPPPGALRFPKPRPLRSRSASDAADQFPPRDAPLARR